MNVQSTVDANGCRVKWIRKNERKNERKKMDPNSIWHSVVFRWTHPSFGIGTSKFNVRWELMHSKSIVLFAKIKGIIDMWNPFVLLKHVLTIQWLTKNSNIFAFNSHSRNPYCLHIVLGCKQPFWLKTSRANKSWFSKWIFFHPLTFLLLPNFLEIWEVHAIRPSK